MVMTIQDKAKLTNFAERLKDENVPLKKGKIYKENLLYGKHQKGNEYKLLDFYSNPENGYQGYAYKSLDDGKIYVVHSGSCTLKPFKFKNIGEIIKDWGLTDTKLFMNKLAGQFYSADYFLDKVRKEQNGGSDTNIEHLGQSLGGTLKDMLGMLEKNKNIKGIGFNTLGAETLEKTLKQKGYKVSGNYSHLDNYLYANEFVSTLKNQVGNVYVSDYIETRDPDFHNVETHFYPLVYKKQYDFNNNTVETKVKRMGNIVKDVIPVVDLEFNTGKFSLQLDDAAKESDVKKVAEKLNDEQLVNSVFQIGVEENVYNVATGDTMHKISENLGVSESELLKTNPWLNDRYSEDKSFALIRPDEKLKLPEGHEKKTVEVSEVLKDVSKNTSSNKKSAVQKKSKGKPISETASSNSSKDDEDGHWITKNGNHILIEDSADFNYSFGFDPKGMAYSMGLVGKPDSQPLQQSQPQERPRTCLDEFDSIVAIDEIGRPIIYFGTVSPEVLAIRNDPEMRRYLGLDKKDRR